MGIRLVDIVDKCPGFKTDFTSHNGQKCVLLPIEGTGFIKNIYSKVSFVRHLVSSFPSMKFVLQSYEIRDFDKQ